MKSTPLNLIASLTCLISAFICCLTILPILTSVLGKSFYDFLSEWQTLVSALIAIAVGYYSIRAVREQIQDAQNSRNEQRNDTARAFLGVAVSHLTLVELSVSTLIDSNNYPITGQFKVPAHLKDSIMRTSINSFLNDTAVFNNLPVGTVNFFMLIRLKLLLLDEPLSAIRSIVTNSQDATISPTSIDKILKATDVGLDEIHLKIQEFLMIYPDLNPFTDTDQYSFRKSDIK